MDLQCCARFVRPAATTDRSGFNCKCDEKVIGKKILAQGFDDYISKPLQVSELKRVLVEGLTHAQKSRAIHA